MMDRIRQFYHAIRATVTEEDRQFIQKNLPPRAQPLFFGMSLADQYHALHVAYTALALASSNDKKCNADLLCRAALLHDIGRVRGSMNVLEKSLAVLVATFFPIYAKNLSQLTRGIFSKVMHIYFYHPAIGANMLERINMQEEANIIRRHHEKLQMNDSIELQLLQRADSMN